MTTRKLLPRLDKVRSFCAKPNCHRSFLHRHHKGHEFLWVSIKPKCWNDLEYKEFVKRYNSFWKRDVVFVCPWHHAEIHLLYAREIFKHQRRRGFKKLSQYSRTEIESLRRRLREVCDEWLSKETPGIHPDTLESFREHEGWS